MPYHTSLWTNMETQIETFLRIIFFLWLRFLRQIEDSSAWPRIVPNVLLGTSLQATGEPERASSGKMLTLCGVPLIPVRKVLSASCYIPDSSLNAWCVNTSLALKCFFFFFLLKNSRSDTSGNLVLKCRIKRLSRQCQGEKLYYAIARIIQNRKKSRNLPAYCGHYVFWFKRAYWANILHEGINISKQFLGQFLTLAYFSPVTL